MMSNIHRFFSNSRVVFVDALIHRFCVSLLDCDAETIRDWLKDSSIMKYEIYSSLEKIKL